MKEQTRGRIAEPRHDSDGGGVDVVPARVSAGDGVGVDIGRHVVLRQTYHQQLVPRRPDPLVPVGLSIDRVQPLAAHCGIIGSRRMTGGRGH
ncbi:hypothetical protein E2C01_018160 [Portunus trituberculatus]|uniref:Uncharacterized protein n=1 Tax=Portunus trituberculatus TaxID=210409 RepID=A0A5B7DTS8_PORTR|nr:hypothetical protein [Portunus trituberculatus]